MPCAFSLVKMKKENGMCSSEQISSEKTKDESVVAEDLGFSRVIYQDKRLYRFTSDSVLLSRFVRAKTGAE